MTLSRSAKRSSIGGRVVSAICLLMLLTKTQACAMANEPQNPTASTATVEVLMLSRGRGVSEEAVKAYAAIRERAQEAQTEGLVLAIEDTMIGLEGERRLCVVFKDEDARSTIGSELRRIGEGVDLLRVRDNACPKQ